MGNTPSRALARAVSMNVGGQFGGFAVGFVSSILLARLLGPTDRGLLAVMIAVGSVGLALVGAGLQTAVQYYASREETSQRALLGNSLAYGGLLAVVLVPAFFAVHELLAAAFADGHGGLVWLLAGLLVPLGFLDFTTAGQLCGRMEFGVWNVLLVGSRLVMLVGVVALVGVAGLGVGGALVATLAASVVVVSVCVVRLAREGRPKPDLALFRRQLLYGAKAQAGSLFNFLTMRLDLLLVGLFAPLASAGQYAVAQSLSELAIYLGTAFQISVLPLISRLDGDERQADASSAALRHHGLLALVAIAANAAIAPLVLLLGYGDAFRPALVPLLILLPAMWFLGTGNVVTGDLSGRGRPGLASAIRAAAAVCTIALDLALIPSFGVTGAALASLVSYAFFGVLAVGVLARVAGRSPWSLVVPTRSDLLLYPRAVRRLCSLDRGARFPRTGDADTVLQRP